MKFHLSTHALDRMTQRKVTHADVVTALKNIESHARDVPQGSTAIIGRVGARQLKVWIVGTVWPPKEPLTVKSVAWKGK